MCSAMLDRGISLQTGRCVTNHGPRSYTFHCLDLLNLAKDKEDFFFCLVWLFFSVGFRWFSPSVSQQQAVVFSGQAILRE